MITKNHPLNGLFNFLLHNPVSRPDTRATFMKVETIPGERGSDGLLAPTAN